MRTFFQRFWSTVAVLLMLAVFFCGALSACKPSEELAAKIAVQYAVGKYIERYDPTERAEQVARILAVVKLAADTAENQSVTIEALRAYVASELEGKLSPADRLLALAIVDAASLELKARVGDGVIQGDQIVKVRAVLTWVTEAATAYAPPGS